MKKLLYSMILLALMLSINHKAFAEEALPILNKAVIDIETEDGQYVVTEQIELINIQGESLEVGHLLSKITNNQVSEVLFNTAEGVVSPSIETGERLDKYILPLNNIAQESVAYTIEYKIPRVDNRFDVPLFVPDFATSDVERNIFISFKAPEGMEIQKNSFPNIIEGGQNHVEKHMTNIPSKVAYVFSKETVYLHSYNVISFIAIFALIVLLVSWGLVEIKKSKRRNS